MTVCQAWRSLRSERPDGAVWPCSREAVYLVQGFDVWKHPTTSVDGEIISAQEVCADQIPWAIQNCIGDAWRISRIAHCGGNS